MCVWMFNVGVCCRVQGGWMNEWMDSCWVVFLFTSVVDEVLEHTNGTIDDLLAYLLHWTLNIALIIINILNPTPKPKKAIHIFHKYHLLQNPINHTLYMLMQTYRFSLLPLLTAWVFGLVSFLAGGAAAAFGDSSSESSRIAKAFTCLLWWIVKSGEDFCEWNLDPLQNTDWNKGNFNLIWSELVLVHVRLKSWKSFFLVVSSIHRISSSWPCQYRWIDSIRFSS